MLCHSVSFRRAVSKEEREEKEEQLLQTLDFIARKQKKIIMLRRKTAWQGNDVRRSVHTPLVATPIPLTCCCASQSKKQSGFFSRVLGGVWGGGKDAVEEQIVALEREIEGLQQVSEQLFLEVDELRNEEVWRWTLLHLHLSNTRARCECDSRGH